MLAMESSGQKAVPEPQQPRKRAGTQQQLEVSIWHVGKLNNMLTLSSCKQLTTLQTYTFYSRKHWFQDLVASCICCFDAITNMLWKASEFLLFATWNGSFCIFHRELSRRNTCKRWQANAKWLSSVTALLQETMRTASAACITEHSSLPQAAGAPEQAANRRLSKTRNTFGSSVRH